jgi:radical SAM superfamily enzyme YgiQ (UPF0313 family)
MKITLIRPNIHPHRSSDAMEPLCFAILKSLTPGDVETVLYDERLEPIPLDMPTDLVAMTVETYTARRAYQLAVQFRRRGIPVVLGGYHPTLLPDEALMFADAVVQGDAEHVWQQIVADAREGRLRRVYRGDRKAPLAGLTPDRSVFRGKRYAPVSLVQYGRGCKYNCDFCSIHAFYGNDLRQRPIADVVDEIRHVGRKHIFFVDDNIFVDVTTARELFTALIPLRIRWSCQISIDVANTPDLVRLMRESGCTTAVVGFESLDDENLRQMKKSWNVREGDYESRIAVFRESGIMIYGTFVFGYDRDTVDSFDAAVDFAIRNQFYLANFNPLTPTPGAPLYDRLRRQGRLIYDRWWLDPTYRYGMATFHPRGMTADELTAGCYRARTRFNTCRSILRRAMAPRTNIRTPYRLGIYLLSNAISRREIHRKQNLPLGGPEPIEYQTTGSGAEGSRSELR